jgi:hypothetical protein
MRVAHSLLATALVVGGIGLAQAQSTAGAGSVIVPFKESVQAVPYLNQLLY